MIHLSRAVTTFLAIGLLSGCVEPVPTTTVSTPASANLEPVSGISKDALVAIMGIPDLGNELLFGVFYYPGKADAAQLAAAPARICKARDRSLVSAKDEALEHPAEMPGTRKLIVRCK